MNKHDNPVFIENRRDFLWSATVGAFTMTAVDGMLYLCGHEIFSRIGLAYVATAAVTLIDSGLRERGIQPEQVVRNVLSRFTPGSGN